MNAECWWIWEGGMKVGNITDQLNDLGLAVVPHHQLKTTQLIEGYWGADEKAKAEQLQASMADGSTVEDASNCIRALLHVALDEMAVNNTDLSKAAIEAALARLDYVLDSKVLSD